MKELSFIETGESENSRGVSFPEKRASVVGTDQELWM
jgi:hypothetical protein